MDLSDDEGLSQEDLQRLSDFPIIEPTIISDPDLQADVTIMDQVIQGKTCQDTWNELLLEDGTIDMESDFNHGFFVQGLSQVTRGAKMMAEGFSMMRLASAASNIPDLTKIIQPILDRTTANLKPTKASASKARGTTWVPPVETMENPNVNPTEVKSEPTSPMAGIETAMSSAAAAMYQEMQRPPRPSSEPSATVTSSGVPPVVPKKRKRKLPNPDSSHFQPMVGKNSVMPDGTQVPKPVTCYDDRGKKKAKCSLCGFMKSYDAVESHIHRDHLNISF